MPGTANMPEAVDNTPRSGDIVKIPAGSTISRDGKIDFHHQPSPVKSFDIGPGLGGTMVNRGGLFDRRLQQGTKSVLAVRVVASGGSTTASEDKLSDEVFGTFGGKIYNYRYFAHSAASHKELMDFRYC